HRHVEDPLAPQRPVEQRREEQLARPGFEGVEVEGGRGEHDARRLEVAHPGGGEEDLPPAHVGHEAEEDGGRLAGRRPDDEVVDPADGVAVGRHQRQLEDPGGVDRLGHAHTESVRDGGYALGKISGSARGPRTWPPHQVTAPVSSRWNSGIRSRNTDRATSISMRARFDPAQRWMPMPKATWRLCARSMTTVSGSGNWRGSRLAAGMVTPSTVTSSVARRPMVTGE